MSQILRALLLTCLFVLAACGGGGSSASSSSATFELEVCSLGCGAGSCSIRQLNTNSDIIFTFSDRVDPNSVTFTEINLINTTNGGSPTGRFLVEDNQVIFRPSYKDTSDGVSFGFDESSEYTLTLSASPADSSVVRSSIGRPNTTPIRCTFTATGIQDFSPGAPTVSVTPSEIAPPTSRDFNVVLTFSDVIRSVQLLNADGSSPTVSVNLVSSDNLGSETVFPFDGDFKFDVDIDNRITTLTFEPIASFPSGGGGTRALRVDVSNQISDLVGNRLLNAGSFVIPLPEEEGLKGEVTEIFANTLKLDEAGSAPGLWLGDGVLDSALNPATGSHPGGGHGAMGELDLDDLVLDTSNGALVTSELLGATVTVPDGTFMASSLNLSQSKTTSAIGGNPLRLFVRGSATIAGSMDFSGEDAPVNFGLHRPHDERLSYEVGEAKPAPSPEMLDLMLDSNEADGGLGGAGYLAAGSGGQGGQVWYNFAGYYDDTAIGWFAEHSNQDLADSGRFSHGAGGVSLVTVHGENGGAVGGVDASGAPLPSASADLLDDDLASGSGMGSFAWPPKSDSIPVQSEVDDRDWYLGFQGDVILAYKENKYAHDRFHRGRSRGGGGGGYWTDGVRGDFHDEDPFFLDAWGEALETPDPDQFSNDPVEQNWDFNGVRTFGGVAEEPLHRQFWPSYIFWDNLTGADLIEDAAGGGFDPQFFGSLPPYYTLDWANGYLRGGAGGGGAGASEHGSFSNEVWGDIALETYRGSDGGGGGAGGGGVQLSVANDLTLTGSILVEGGNGADSAAQVSSSFAIDTLAFELTRPGDAGGGGGSGGALLLQVGGDLNLGSDSLMLSGGTGGIGAVGNHGGDGGIGLLRIESASAPSLANAAGIVDPIESYDLATRPEFGLTGANSDVFDGQLLGATGDMTVPVAVGTGDVFFNGNSTGVLSGYYPVPSSILFVKFTDYEVTCEWSDGTGGGATIVYSDSNPTAPGGTPLWIALSTAYGFEDQGSITVAEGSESAWVIPGYNTVGGGATELQATPAQTRLLRYQLVFDQDLVSALIGSNPNAYFRVTEASFPWTE